MKLIIGLGNPGTRYILTRHNIGFMVVDALATSYSSERFREQHKALTTKVTISGEDCLLVKPQTFMNLSGDSVRALMDFYKITDDQILVIHDEIDLPFGHLRYGIKRGHGGHNGIRNIHQMLGHDNYARLRMGVGRPTDARIDVAAYVLMPFSTEEHARLPEFFELSIDSIEYFVQNGIEKTSTIFNSGTKGSIQN